MRRLWWDGRGHGRCAARIPECVGGVTVTEFGERAVFIRSRFRRFSVRCIGAELTAEGGEHPPASIAGSWWWSPTRTTFASARSPWRRSRSSCRCRPSRLRQPRRPIAGVTLDPDRRGSDERSRLHEDPRTGLELGCGPGRERAPDHRVAVLFPRLAGNTRQA